LTTEDVEAAVRDAHAVAHWLIGRLRGAALPSVRRLLLTELQSVLAGLVAALAQELIPALPPAVQALAADCEGELRRRFADLMVMTPDGEVWSDALDRLEQALHAQRGLEDSLLLPALREHLTDGDARALGQAFKERMALHGGSVPAARDLPLARPADVLEEARLVLGLLASRGSMGTGS
jgi:hypothetical protein